MKNRLTVDQLIQRAMDMGFPPAKENYEPKMLKFLKQTPPKRIASVPGEQLPGVPGLTGLKSKYPFLGQ